MWKKLNYANGLYYMKFSQSNSYEVFITDYMNLWSVSFPKERFLVCLYECNSDVEIEEAELLKSGHQMLSDPDGLKKINIRNIDNALSVTLTEAHGCHLKLEMKLLKCSNELFFLHVTQELLKTIADLKSSQNELRQFLKQKDKEIDDYKVEAGEVGLRCRKTPIYDDDSHLRKHKVYKDYFGIFDIPTELLNKKIEAPRIKEEPLEVKNGVIKLESHTTEPSLPISTMHHYVKTEPVKEESQSRQVSPRKRMKKLNY